MNFEHLKDKLDILDVVQKYVKLKKVGKYFTGLCPFHSETKPSFFVSPEKQIFKCFGCGEGGDVFKFLMKIENLSYRELLEKLKEEYNLEIETSSRSKQKENVILEINYSALKFFKEKLKENPSVFEYLKKRGINEKSIEFFEIGYSPGNTLLRDYLFSLGYGFSDIKEAGLLDSQNYDRFQSRIIFPLRNERGKLVGFMGRIFPENNFAPKYLNTPETSLFKKSNFLYGLYYAGEYITLSKKVIIVEGTIDFILSFQNNLKNTVAVSGSSLTLDHLRKIKKYAQEIVLAFDNDFSGFKASLRANLLAKKLGFSTKKLIYSQKDLAEFFEKDGKKENLKEVIFEDWLLEYLLNTYQEKSKILEIFLPQIKILPATEADEYLEKLSQSLKINKKLLEEELVRIEVDERELTKTPQELTVEFKGDLEDKFSLRILSLIYAKNNFFKENILEILSDKFKELASRIIENKLEEKEKDFFEMMKTYLEENKVDFQKELEKTIKNLKKIKLKKKLKELKNHLELNYNQDLINEIKKILLEIKKLEKNGK